MPIDVSEYHRMHQHHNAAGCYSLLLRLNAAMANSVRPPCKTWVSEHCVHPIALPLYGSKPSAGICQQCEHYEGLPRGLGDVIHTALGFPVVRQIVKAVKPDGCNCAERRKRLNGVK